MPPWHYCLSVRLFFKQEQPESKYAHAWIFCQIFDCKVKVFQSRRVLLASHRWGGGWTARYLSVFETGPGFDVGPKHAQRWVHRLWHPSAWACKLWLWRRRRVAVFWCTEMKHTPCCQILAEQFVFFPRDTDNLLDLGWILVQQADVSLQNRCIREHVGPASIKNLWTLLRKSQHTAFSASYQSNHELHEPPFRDELHLEYGFILYRFWLWWKYIDLRGTQSCLRRAAYYSRTPQQDVLSQAIVKHTELYSSWSSLDRFVTNISKLGNDEDWKSTSAWKYHLYSVHSGLLSKN